tara:strand:- start:16 stop:240 length:225 start_codon:yes stop_codon:yes gene_type:complete
MEKTSSFKMKGKSPLTKALVGNQHKLPNHLKKRILEAPETSSPMTKKGPCWKGYEMIGMKKKGGRQVPNCVPKK